MLVKYKLEIAFDCFVFASIFVSFFSL